MKMEPRTVAALVLLTLCLLMNVPAHATILHQDSTLAPAGIEPARQSLSPVEIWYAAITPAINILSKIVILPAKEWLENKYLNIQDIREHEGKHPFVNTRYKEWWYFDLHADSGLVLSCSLVLSIVRPHYFLWVYDPAQQKVLLEIEHDGRVEVNRFGTTGLELSSEFITITGQAETGYHMIFEGKTLRGEIDFKNPIPGRHELHAGTDLTWYALYQIPMMDVSGTLTTIETGDQTAMSGKGYKDHWWGIDNRYTKWEWFQIKFTNGWMASFYQGRYGAQQEDLHRYAWLYRPGSGYLYFDEDTFLFTQNPDNETWTASAATDNGSLTITATRRAERYELKPVKLYGVPLGEVHYYQYPVTAQASFVSDNGTTMLESDKGMLEWDWDSIW